MLGENKVLDLVGRIYAAAEEPSLWPAFLDRLGSTVRGTVTAFVFDDLRGHASVAASVRMDPAFSRLYEEYFSSRNAWAIAAGPRVQTGAVLTSQMILPDAELVRSEYYNGFLRPQDARHLLGTILFREAHSYSQVSVLRPGRREPFSDREVRLMQALMPHLQRAVRIHRRLVHLKTEGRFASEALDRAPFGVVLVDSRAHALLVNRAAAEMLASGDGLSLRANGITAARSDESAALRKLVFDAVQGLDSGSLKSSGAMTISRPSMRRPYSILVMPLRSESPLGEARAVAAVFVSDPERKMEPDRELLRKLYRFTPAEARFASHLLRGESVEETALGLEISMNTARTHVRSLLVKTGTKRLSELLRILVGGLTSLRLR